MLDELRFRTTTFPRAQAVSLGFHLAFIGLLLIPIARQIPLRFAPPGVWVPPPGQLREPPLKFLQEIGGKRGGGGHQDPGPATKGQIRFSWMPVAPPGPVKNQAARLTVTPTVIGPPELQIPVDADRWGDPYAKAFTPWFGRGGPNGIGDGKGNGLGDDKGDGFGIPGPYPSGYISPICAYCPNPTFTDEAIKAKYQGTVVLRVLVSADGRAERIQVMKGVGLGLDERAAEKVRTWHFRPGRGPNGKAAAMVVLIEVQFRQF